MRRPRGHGQVRPRPPLVLDVAAGVDDVERLERRRRLPRLQQVLHLEMLSVDRRHRAVRVGEEAVRVGVEVGERVVRVGALDAEVERVVRVELLEGAAEGDRVVLGELRHAVLQLERVVAEQVERRERLDAERGQRAAGAVADDDERKAACDVGRGSRPAWCSRRAGCSSSLPNTEFHSPTPDLRFSRIE